MRTPGILRALSNLIRSGWLDFSPLNLNILNPPRIIPWGSGRKTNKRRTPGGSMNQRQTRKRAAQGAKIKHECRLKQRRA